MFGENCSFGLAIVISRWHHIVIVNEYIFCFTKYAGRERAVRGKELGCSK